MDVMIAHLQPGGEFRNVSGERRPVRFDEYGNAYWLVTEQYAGGPVLRAKATSETRRRWASDGGRPDNYDDLGGLRADG